MEREFAKQIITEYVFSNFELESIYKFVDASITDELNRKLYAESLLTSAMKAGVIALNFTKNEVIKECIAEIKNYSVMAYDWNMNDKTDDGNVGYIEQGLFEAVERLQMLIG